MDRLCRSRWSMPLGASRHGWAVSREWCSPYCHGPSRQSRHRCEVRMMTPNTNLQAPGRSIALLGGTPAFGESLHVGRPNIGDRGRFLALVAEMLDRRWLTNDGPLGKEFERRIADLVGVKHCIAMRNAPIALEIAIRALDLRGEVIVPSYTFVATAHALQWQEITPVFADIDPRTHNIDPAAIERLITPRTTGIIGVHVWGRPCDTAAIEAIANRRGQPAELRGVSGRAERPSRCIRRRVRPGRAQQLPVCRRGGRPRGGLPDPRRAGRGPARGQCAGPEVLLARLPPDGAVSLAAAERRAPA